MFFEQTFANIRIDPKETIIWIRIVIIEILVNSAVFQLNLLPNHFLLLVLGTIHKVIIVNIIVNIFQKKRKWRRRLWDKVIDGNILQFIFIEKIPKFTMEQIG